MNIYYNWNRWRRQLSFVCQIEDNKQSFFKILGLNILLFLALIFNCSLRIRLSIHYLYIDCTQGFLYALLSVLFKAKKILLILY
jgi:hypothetical protein